MSSAHASNLLLAGLKSNFVCSWHSNQRRSSRNYHGQPSAFLLEEGPHLPLASPNQLTQVSKSFNS